MIKLTKHVLINNTPGNYKSNTFHVMKRCVCSIVLVAIIYNSIITKIQKYSYYSVFGFLLVCGEFLSSSLPESEGSSGNRKELSLLLCKESVSHILFIITVNLPRTADAPEALWTPWIAGLVLVLGLVLDRLLVAYPVPVDVGIETS